MQLLCNRIPKINSQIGILLWMTILIYNYYNKMSVPRFLFSFFFLFFFFVKYINLCCAIPQEPLSYGVDRILKPCLNSFER